MIDLPLPPECNDMTKATCTAFSVHDYIECKDDIMCMLSSEIRSERFRVNGMSSDK